MSWPGLVPGHFIWGRPKFRRVLPLFDAGFCTYESNWKPNSGEFAGGNLVTSRQCRRHAERLLRIAVPTFVFGLAVAASLKAGMFAGLVWSAAAARDVETLVMNSAQQVVEAREAHDF